MTREQDKNTWISKQNVPLLAFAFALGVFLTAVVCLSLPRASSAPLDEPRVNEQAGKPGSKGDGPIDMASTFPSWDPESASLAELVAFVDEVCDPASSAYKEPRDRVATFDMDGTLISEKAPFYIDYMVLLHRVLDDPDYHSDAETIKLCEEIRSYAYRGEKNSDLSEGRHRASASEFAGMTPEEFRAYVGDFLDNVEVRGFDGMTYGESFYKPMSEVVDYLRAHEFQIWIVSASQRDIVRAVAARLGIEPDHVIANDVVYVSTGQGSEDALDYTMGQEEDVVLGEPLIDGCEKTGKALAIAREIGKRPTLAFGNSSGDYAMLNYAELSGGMAMIVVADDEEREYGDAEAAKDTYALADEESWTTFSMRDDWATIYGEDVVKTERVLDEEEEELAEAA